MSDFSSKRMIGLDVVRAAAIMMVLISHLRQTLKVPDDWMSLTFGGWYGVELFFVLSGFLIGTILIREYDKGLTLGSLGRFWFRRWMRTLPVYFAALLYVWIKYDWFHISYLVFLQVPLTNSSQVLPVAWSLAVEEWFYLCFPVALMALTFIRKRPVLLQVTLLFIAVPLAYRIGQYTGLYRGGDYRGNTFRFDSIAIGVLLAYLMASEVWRKRLFASKNKVYLLAGVFLAFELIRVNWKAFGLAAPLPLPSWYLTVSFTVTGVSAAFIVAAFYMAEIRLPKNIEAIVGYVSTVSYSVYIWHLLFLGAVLRELSQGKGIMLYLLTMIAMLVLAYVPYMLIERPFMSLRDAITERMKARATRAVALS